MHVKDRINCSGIILIGSLFINSLFASEFLSFEHKIKAVYIFNFTKFITWPADAFADDKAPINICINGSESFINSIENVVADEKVHSRGIQIKRLLNQQDFGNCHIAFIANNVQINMKGMLNSKHTLIVGESKALFQNGGMVKFGILNDKVSFEFNLPAIAKSNLKISSKLLALSRPLQLQ